MSGQQAPRRVLVAGLGNIFLSDDGFGVEAAGRLARRELPPGVDVVDIGVRGVHLAHRLLDGYDTVVLLDATARGGEPGTVYLIDHTETAVPETAVPETAVPEVATSGAVAVDGHRMTPDAVLAMLGAPGAATGGTRPSRVVVVGCEPATLEEGIGLSAPVATALHEAVAVVLRVLARDAAAAAVVN